MKVKMTSNATVYTVTVNKICTVEELKKACEKETSIPPESQNLVFKGRILDNTKKIDEYGLQNDNTIILVKKVNPQEKKNEPPKQESQSSNNQNTSNTNTNTNTNSNTNPNANPNTNTNTNTNSNNGNPFGMDLNSLLQGMGGMGGMSGMDNLGMGGMNPQMMGQMLNNPMYMQMMQNLISDPNTLNMMMNHPQIKPLIDSNPMMREIFSNPELMRQMFSPEMMQQMSTMLNSGGMGGMGMNPFGMGMPMTNPNNNNNNNSSGNMNPYANLFNMTMGNFGMGQNTNNNPQDNVDPKEKYKEQLAQLKDMGFINEEANIQVLKQCDGNVQFAIEKLLNMLK